MRYWYRIAMGVLSVSPEVYSQSKVGLTCKMKLLVLVFDKLSMGVIECRFTGVSFGLFLKAT